MPNKPNLLFILLGNTTDENPVNDLVYAKQNLTELLQFNGSEIISFDPTSIYVQPTGEAYSFLTLNEDQAHKLHNAVCSFQTSLRGCAREAGTSDVPSNVAYYDELQRLADRIRDGIIAPLQKLREASK